MDFRRLVTPSPLRRLRLLFVAAAVSACGEDIVLPPASIPVAEQQIMLFALTDTPVNTPSAYTITSLAEVRVDLSNDYDFAFDIGPRSRYGLTGTPTDTVAVLVTRHYMGFVADGGFQPATGIFDSIMIAPATGYEQQLPAVIDVGTVLFAASRLRQCNFNLIRPHYAKLVVQEIDRTLRRATIRLVVDPNCGYRSLAPGIPTE